MVKSCFRYIQINVKNFSFELSYFHFRPDFVVILSPLRAQICYFGLGGMPMFEPLVGSFCFGHFGSWDEF